MEFCARYWGVNNYCPPTHPPSLTVAWPLDRWVYIKWTWNCSGSPVISRLCLLSVAVFFGCSASQSERFCSIGESVVIFYFLSVMVVCVFIAVHCILMICVLVGFFNERFSLWLCIAFHALMWQVVCTWSCFADFLFCLTSICVSLNAGFAHSFCKPCLFPHELDCWGLVSCLC